MDEVILSCGFMSDDVKRVLGDIYDGMRLRYAIEDEPLGTAGPVRLAYDEGLLEERLFVLNGDVLTDIDLTAELEQHERKGARATLALHPVEDTSSYGVVPTDDDGAVLEFIEKGDDEPPTNRINAGAYVIERDLVETSIPAGRPVSFEREVFPALVGHGLYGFDAAGYWIDIGTPERYLEATWDLLAGRVSLHAPAARRDRLARLRELPRVGRARGAAERAGAPLLGGHGRARRAVGARTTACTWERMRRSWSPCSASASAWASGAGRAPRDGGRGGGDRAARSPSWMPARGRTGGDGLPSLDGDSIERVDPGGMLGDVLAQPLQLGDALWRTQSAGIRPRDQAGRDGRVRDGRVGDRRRPRQGGARRPRHAGRSPSVRGYALESWTPPESFVLCASYSGNTEETLACFEAAGAAGAQRAVLTTGGKLAELAREEGVPVIGVPAGMQPRAAVIYMTIGVIECAALCGAAPALHAEIDTAVALLERLVEEWGPGAPDDSLAKSVARAARRHDPGRSTAPRPRPRPARRWATQINENAKSPAFWTELPEANHNQICGWERGRDLGPLAGVFLCDPDQHPRVQRHVELAEAELERAGAPALQLHTEGDSRLERVLSAVLLGDLVSVYMAVLAGVDPTETRRSRASNSSSEEKPRTRLGRQP